MFGLVLAIAAAALVVGASMIVAAVEAEELAEGLAEGPAELAELVAGVVEHTVLEAFGVVGHRAEVIQVVGS